MVKTIHSVLLIATLFMLPQVTQAWGVPLFARDIGNTIGVWITTPWYRLSGWSADDTASFSTSANDQALTSKCEESLENAKKNGKADAISTAGYVHNCSPGISQSSLFFAEVILNWKNLTGITVLLLLLYGYHLLNAKLTARSYKTPAPKTPHNAPARKTAIQQVEENIPNDNDSCGSGASDASAWERTRIVVTGCLVDLRDSMIPRAVEDAREAGRKAERQSFEKTVKRCVQEVKTTLGEVGLTPKQEKKVTAEVTRAVVQVAARTSSGETPEEEILSLGSRIYKTICIHWDYLKNWIVLVFGLMVLLHMLGVNLYDVRNILYRINRQNTTFRQNLFFEAGRLANKAWKNSNY